MLNDVKNPKSFVFKAFYNYIPFEFVNFLTKKKQKQKKMSVLKYLFFFHSTEIYNIFYKTESRF